MGYLVKRSELKENEFETLLLTSIVRGSFLTEDEESWEIERSQQVSWLISWNQYTSEI